jgi:acyl carrier protein
MECSGVSSDLEAILRDDLNVDVSRITPDSHLIHDLGLDSVAFAVGMVAIEDRLGVALSDEELLTCNTIGELDGVIKTKAQA